MHGHWGTRIVQTANVVDPTCQGHDTTFYSVPCSCAERTFGGVKYVKLKVHLVDLKSQDGRGLSHAIFIPFLYICLPGSTIPIHCI